MEGGRPGRRAGGRAGGRRRLIQSEGTKGEIGRGNVRGRRMEIRRVEEDVRYTRGERDES